MTLRTAIVGCGAVAQRLYRKPLQRLEKRGLLRVEALVDSVPGHASALASFFPGAKQFSDLDAALGASAPELTLILTPAHLHCSQSIQALEHGSHVLCEKPMAASDGECASMNAVAAKTDRVLAIGMIRRFFPAYARFRQMVQEGQLGALASFELREGHKFEWDVTTPAAFRPRSQGGTGVLFDIGPHVVDYLAWTFGRLDPLSYRDDALAGVESGLSMEVRSDACRGSIHLTWDYPQVNELRLAGERGEAVLRIDRFDQMALKTGSAFEPQNIRVSFPGDAETRPRVHISPRSYGEAVYCQIVQVVRAIRLGEAPAVDGEAGRASVTLLEAALAMADPLEAPWLDVTQQIAYRRLHWGRAS